ncbi:MAG: hypothetical protein NTX22_08970 [Ignavibacteriales bacterium]|nr:hypothetical protein [Ignavibacteriales bacterium]
MKKLFIHIVVFILAFVLYSCEKPSPTELAVDENQTNENLAIEVIAKEPDNFVYSNGYDSTGITSPVPNFSSVISVSSVKTTYKTKTIKIVLAQAIFFDKNQPIKIRSGRTVGYKTRTLGMVLFDEHPARLVPFIVHRKEHNAVRDSVVGSYHILYKKENIGDPFNFVHESNVDFKLRVMGNIVTHFQIPTPKEIIGSVEIKGNNNLERNFLLSWNGSTQGKIDVVIGGIKKGVDKKEVFPFFKLRARDNGELLIPAYLWKDFPFSLYDKIVFTFIRQKVFDYEPNSTLNDHSISAQSIHSIQLDIP